MENTLKQKLAAGAQPIGTFFDTASVSLMECLGRTGLDFAIIDNEHSPIEAETTAALVRAAELSGICPIARVREISRPAVLKLLDVGVQGLIVPNVKTLEQVQELVNYAKYYPIGQRGFCPSRKDGWGFDGLGSVPETMRHFNGETLLFPQCETAESLAIIEDICAVDGVDGIFVGPFDLSISMGMPGQFDAPEFQAAITRIVAACRAVLVLAAPLEQLIIAQLLERERQAQLLRHRQEHVLGHHVPDLETAGIAVHRLLHARLQGRVRVIEFKKLIHIRFRFVCHVGHS